jgi:hypothetical protein
LSTLRLMRLKQERGQGRDFFILTLSLILVPFYQTQNILEALMHLIIKHTYRSKIVNDQERGIIKYQEEKQLTIRSKFPTEPEPPEADVPPSPRSDRFRYPPPSSN